MIVEQSPQWGAAGDGEFAANYSINFVTDLSHRIPTTGEWQGSGKKANTIFIDNYANNFQITVTSNNFVRYVPAYAKVYISIPLLDNVDLVSDFPAVVTVRLMTQSRTDETVARGNSPPGVAADPYFSSVIGLYHFDGINGATVTVDSSASGYGNVTFTSPAALTTAEKVFGVSSARINATGANGNRATSASTKALVATGVTIEFRMRIGSYSSAVNGSIIFSSPAVISLNPIGNGQYQLQSSNLSGVSGNLNTGTWYSFALVFIGTYGILFQDGVVAFSGSATAVNTAAQNLVMGVANTANSAYSVDIDELRITNVPRYLTPYTPATTAFPDY